MTTTVQLHSASLDEQLKDGYTLPATWYTDPSIHKVERSEIFEQTWQYVGPASWAAKPGDFFPCMAGHVPLIITRDTDGELRAVVNVCRHRGHRVVLEPGSGKSLRCPYHGWAYRMDGTLKAAPRCADEPDFDVADYPLRAVQVATWGPFVFVNPDPDAAPLADALGALPDALAASGLDINHVQFYERAEETVPANWKIGVANDLECYHCPVAHPGFKQLLNMDPETWKFDALPTFTSQVYEVADGFVSGEADNSYAIDGEVHRPQAHLLYPNLGLHVYPGRPNATLMQWRPVGVDKMVVIRDFYHAPDASKEFVEGARSVDDEVWGEDVNLLIGVQQGLSSGMLEQGRLIPKSEPLVAAFERWVYEKLSSAPDSV